MGIVRRTLQVTLLLATFAVGAAAAAIVVSQTAWFRDWLRGVAIRQANQHLNGTLSIGRLGGNLFFGLELENLGITSRGERVVEIRRAGVDYSILRFAAGDLTIDHVRLDRPRLVLRREAGKWNLGGLVRSPSTEKDRRGPGTSISIGEIGIDDGRLSIESEPGDAGAVGTAGHTRSTRIDRIDARLSFAYEPVHYTANVAHLSFTCTAPDIALEALSGTIAVRDDAVWLDGVTVKTGESHVRIDGRVAHYASRPDLGLIATSSRLSLPEMGRIVPALSGILLVPALRVNVRGPLDRAAFDFTVTSAAGDASGAVTADLEGPDRGLAGTVHLVNVDLAPVVKAPAAASRITGVADIDLRFPSGAGRGPVVGSYRARADVVDIAGYSARRVVAEGRVDAGNRVTVAHATAEAYGGMASTSGTIQPGVLATDGRRGVALDLHGDVFGLDLRRLPKMLKVPPAESRLNFEYRVSGVGTRLRGDATLDASTLSGALLGPRTTASFSTMGQALAFAADGAVTGLDVERVGRAFRIPALSSPRFASALNGRFSVAGQGTTVEELALEARASLANSEMSGVALPVMALDARIASGGGVFRAKGAFANLDPARFSGKPGTSGQVSGRVDASVTLARLGAVTPATVEAAGTLSISPSHAGGLAIESADAEVSYEAETARVSRFRLAGPDMSATGSGTLAIGSTGTSDLSYQVQFPKLSTIARLFDLPLSGAVTVNGRVSGNRSVFTTEGRLQGSDIGYGGNKALGAEATYRVRLPDLDRARLSVGGDVRATLLKVADQEVNDLKATLSLAEQTLTFDVEARSLPREARASGTLLLHTDHDEVHLNRFAFATQGVEWTIAAGYAPVVRYGGGRVSVDGLRLVSGTQAINAAGFVDRTASDLRASATGVDLARLDTWLVGERRLGGILDAGVRLTGPSDGLLVDADFSIDNGAFRDFRYETLGGHVSYTGGRASVNARLFQGPRAWIGVKGTVPKSLWTGPAEGVGRAASDGSSADAPVDVAIDSSPIDLGLVQGFTGEVSKASGFLEAHVRVAGTARDPQVSGSVGVTNGAFALASSGVSYTSLNGRVAFQPGRARLDAVSVSDEHGNRLQVEGSVQLQQKQLGALALSVSSKDFEVLHRDLGRVAVNADLQVGGYVQAPEVSGDLEIGAAQVNIDKVLEMTSSSAYSTEPQHATPPRAPSETAPSDTGATPTSGRGPGFAVPVPLLGTLPMLPPVGTAGPGTTPPANAQAVTAGRGRRAATPANPYEAMRLDVRVRVPPAFVITGKDLRPGGGAIGLGNVNVTLGGDVQLEKRPAGPLRLVGQVNTVRGVYGFQGRRFDIQRDGRVRFDGVIPVNPSLDVTATRVISGVEARVHVGGTARKPDLTLTSRPPLDSADILALIVFNQPANQLGEGQQATLAQRASALATGFVASKLADSIGRALNLDTFEIQTAPESSGGQGAEVTVGEQLGQRLFFRLTQGVGADNLSQFVLDYQIAAFLRFQTTMTQGESATRSLVRRVERSGVDLIFFFSY